MATRPPRITSTRRQPTTRAPRAVDWSRVTRGPSWRSGFGVAPRPAKPAVPAPANTAAVPQYSLSNLPPDASYDDQIALLQRQRDEGIAGIVGERSRTLTDYGFQEGPNGAITFDANNPFSKASIMKKTYDTNRRSTAQSLGAGGQLYSGSFQNAQDLVNRNQLQSEDALLSNVQAFLTRNTGQQKAAGTNYELAAGQAYADRVGRFQSNPLYDPATAESTPATKAALGPTKATAAVGRPQKTMHGQRFYQRASDKKWIPF